MKITGRLNFIRLTLGDLNKPGLALVGFLLAGLIVIGIFFRDTLREKKAGLGIPSPTKEMSLTKPAAVDYGVSGEPAVDKGRILEVEFTEKELYDKIMDPVYFKDKIEDSSFYNSKKDVRSSLLRAYTAWESLTPAGETKPPIVFEGFEADELEVDGIKDALDSQGYQNAFSIENSLINIIKPR